MESQIAAEQIQAEIKVTLSELQQERKDAWWVNDSIPRGDECCQAITVPGKPKKKRSAWIQRSEKKSRSSQKSKRYKRTVLELREQKKWTWAWIGGQRQRGREDGVKEDGVHYECLSGTKGRYSLWKSQWHQQRTALTRYWCLSPGEAR